MKLTDTEELLLHNLLTRKYWEDNYGELKLTKQKEENDKNSKEKSNSKNNTDNRKNIIPQKWNMTKGIELYDWQKKCVKDWLELGKGTIKVVTGAGKTILALAIIEALQNKHKNTCVVIVVPTVVLQNQWYEELIKNGNIPDKAIVKLGGGNDGQFTKGVRIIIAILKSAADKLHQIVDEKVASKLLLVVDECHRAGAREMSKVFKTNRKWSLGLSATPEREEELTDHALDYDNSMLGLELGPIIYQMDVKQAFEMGIMPEFEIIHIGLYLSEKEQLTYDAISKRMRESMAQLYKLVPGKMRSGNYFAAIQQLVMRNDAAGKAAKLYTVSINQRKQLLYNARARAMAIKYLLDEKLKDKQRRRGIIFHETIDGVMALYQQLYEADYPVVVENSNLPENIREQSIELYRNGTARIIVSARSLIEGFNVPETDLGIIAASSNSVRQRIQTLGRVLRKTSNDSAEISQVYVFYIKGTNDENIYKKTDWDHILGAKRNRYFVWDIVNGQKPIEDNKRNNKS